MEFSELYAAWDLDERVEERRASALAERPGRDSRLLVLIARASGVAARAFAALEGWAAGESTGGAAHNGATVR